MLNFRFARQPFLGYIESQIALRLRLVLECDSTRQWAASDTSTGYEKL